MSLGFINDTVIKVVEKIVIKMLNVVSWKRLDSMVGEAKVRIHLIFGRSFFGTNGWAFS